MEELQNLFESMYNVDTTSKNRFIISISNESVLEFLDLHRHEQNKICVDVFAKPTHSFTYVLPSTCYRQKNMNNVPKGTALSFKRICNTDGKFEIRSYEYQNYLIIRNCKLTLVKLHFHAIINISRREARQVKSKVTECNFNLINVYNPVMKNLENVLNDNVDILYGDLDM